MCRSAFSAQQLQSALEGATHARWSLAGGASGQVTLTLDPAIARAEGYRLTVAQEGVLIAGHDLAGLFYGVQTLRQLLQTQGATLPRMVLEDWPDFPARYALYASAKAGVEGLTRVWRWNWDQ